MRAKTLAVVLLIIILVAALGIWNMMKKEAKQVEIMLSGSRVGTCIIYSDYSYQITCNDPTLKAQIKQVFDQILTEDKALLKYEEMEGDVLIMKGDYLSRKDKNFVYALLNTAADRINAILKDGYFSFEIKH